LRPLVKRFGALLSRSRVREKRLSMDRCCFQDGAPCKSSQLNQSCRLKNRVLWGRVADHVVVSGLDWALGAAAENRKSSMSLSRSVFTEFGGCDGNGP
jgi:hypothetical protein